ncbi:MAG: histidine kinase [Pseudomonadota bacterium]|jgi:two-component system chemotaxis sensor kinase CheA
MNASFKITETLLIVEDDTELREAICETLDGLGCPIIAVPSAEDALVVMRDRVCFAVVSDYRMPGMNGIELCRRAKEEFPRLKFVILTGYADKQTVLEGFRHGIDDLLEKPQDLGRLCDMATAFVTQRQKEIEQDQEELKFIRKIFCDEANELLRDIEGLIFKLEDASGQSDVIDVLFRKAHTLKGSAGAFQGAEKISAVTHAYENLLQAIKKGKLVPSQSLTHVLLQAADVIKNLVTDFENFKETKINLQPFIDALNQWTEGRAGPAAGMARSDATVDSVGTVAEDVAPSVQQVSETNAAPSAALSTFSFAPVESGQTVTEEEEDGILVTIDKLNSFMELSGELVVLKNAYHATIKQVSKLAIPTEQKQRLEEMNQSLDKISEQIQAQIMEVRKVQLKVAFQKFPRVVRQASQDLGKQVRLEMTGIDLGVDKSIAKALSSSLVHVLRNSVDHGIEAAQLRRDSGKPEQGMIQVEATQIGEKIHITINDDGAGIDADRVRKKAIEKGLVDRDSAFRMSDSEVVDLIFLPGFSTAEKVTNVSGRGVGMDVVRTEISRLGGTVTVESTPRVGSKIVLKIPIPKTVLVENTLLAESGGHQIVIPLVSISKIAPVKELILSKVDGRMTCQHEGSTIPLGDYRSFIESPLHGSSLDKKDFSPDALVLIISHKDHSLALVVDKVIDQLEAVVRPFDNVVEKLVGFKGTSLLDSEHVAFVLDAESLVNEAYAA